MIKISTYITLFVAICLSAVAAFFSVLGLMAIFSASPQAIMVMAIVLETAKVSTAYWCNLNWRILPATVKTYLVIAVIILMGITSLGIYGFLAKAHIVQKSDISVNYGTKIKSQNAQIAAKQQQIESIDQQISVIDSVIDTAAKKGYVSKSLQLNRKYAKDKQELINQKTEYQQEILVMQEKRILVESDKLQSESEIGPLKYIANLIYDDADAKQLNTAVRWLIIILVAVFDPLAIALLIGTGYILRYIENPIQRKPVALRKPVVTNKKVIIKDAVNREDLQK